MTSRSQRLLLKLKSCAKFAASTVDVQDFAWILATSLVVRGMWVLFGDGYAYLAAGAMIAIPSMVMWATVICRSMKGGEK